MAFFFLAYSYLLYPVSFEVYIVQRTSHCQCNPYRIVLNCEGNHFLNYKYFKNFVAQIHTESPNCPFEAYNHNTQPHMTSSEVNGPAGILIEQLTDGLFKVIQISFSSVCYWQWSISSHHCATCAHTRRTAAKIHALHEVIQTINSHLACQMPAKRKLKYP